MKLPKLSRGQWSLAFGILAVFLAVVIFSRQRLRTAVVFAVVTAVVVCERRLKRAQAEEAQPEPAEDPARNTAAPVASPAAETSRPADPSPASLPEMAGKYLRIARFAFDRKALVEANFWAMKSALEGGGAEARRLMDRYRSVWVAKGCPDDPGGPREDYPEESILISVAVFWLNSGINAVRAKNRLKRLADGGNDDAARYLDFMKKGRRAS